MKANLRAEYKKNLFNETVRTLRDPDADVEPSLRRKVKITAYFKEVMETLDKMDG